MLPHVEGGHHVIDDRRRLHGLTSQLGAGVWLLYTGLRAGQSPLVRLIPGKDEASPYLGERVLEYLCSKHLHKQPQDYRMCESLHVIRMKLFLPKPNTYSQRP